MPDDIAIALAAETHNGRVAMGSKIATEFKSATSGPERGFVRPKGESKSDAVGITAGGPTTKGRGNPDPDGAAHTIKAVRAPQVPQAAPTQANGKIVPPSHRSGKNFYAQTLDSGQ